MLLTVPSFSNSFIISLIDMSLIDILLNKSTVFELMECFFEFFMITSVSKLLLICGIKEPFSCFKCSKSFVLSTILPLGLLRGGFVVVRVWQG